jgi:alpha-beta hydrolase superfamily lysophospholipase
LPDSTTDDGYFSARDGLRLFRRTTRPAGAPIAHVVVLHGYAEHLGRQSEITRALSAAGYAAHSFDCRGHGQSGGKRAHVDTFDEYLQDLADFFAQVRENAQGRPLFFLGHSHGALIGIRYLLDHPDAVRGAILSSPYLRLKLSVSPVKLMAGRLLSRVLPSLPMRNDLKAEQLTRDVEIQNATRRDPLYQQIATPRWFLLLFGGADPIADPSAGREFFEYATSKDKQHKRYDGLLHELFHEPERDVVFRDVIGWLDERGRRAEPRAATGEGG